MEIAMITYKPTKALNAPNQNLVMLLEIGSKIDLSIHSSRHNICSKYCEPIHECPLIMNIKMLCIAYKGTSRELEDKLLYDQKTI